MILGILGCCFLGGWQRLGILKGAVKECPTDSGSEGLQKVEPGQMSGTSPKYLRTPAPPCANAWNFFLCPPANFLFLVVNRTDDNLSNAEAVDKPEEMASTYASPPIRFLDS